MRYEPGMLLEDVRGDVRVVRVARDMLHMHTSLSNMKGPMWGVVLTPSCTASFAAWPAWLAAPFAFCT